MAVKKKRAEEEKRHRTPWQGWGLVIECEKNPSDPGEGSGVVANTIRVWSLLTQRRPSREGADGVKSGKAKEVVPSICSRPEHV